MSNEDVFEAGFFDDDDSTADVSLNHDDAIKVLIVDDEPEIHSVTKLALNNFEFKGRPIVFLDAYSGEEAKEMLSSHTDIAVVLLDVVMETDHSGLDVARWIREDIKNDIIRIILRTGQPGQAPERQVICDYDINDYKAKTELTSQKLFTLMYTTLRSHEHIITLEQNKYGMERVIEATKQIIGIVDILEFLQASLDQLINLIGVKDSIVITTNSHSKRNINIIGSTGALKKLPHYTVVDDLPFFDIMEECLNQKKTIFKEKEIILYCENQINTAVFYVAHNGDLNDLDEHLLHIFTENIVIALENTSLNEQIKNSQREMIYRLGEIIESRSKETGNHVKRVAKYSELIAILYGLDENRCSSIMLASPLHDIGKVGIPDSILNKPSKLDPDEWEIMKTHAQIGQKMLEGSNQSLLDTGSLIAGTHHERWDGTGYPLNLEGNNIPIEGRITALADIFDALSSERCYKPAWSHDKVVAFIMDERGKIFEPKLVDLMVENMDKFIKIQQQYIG